MRASGLPAWSIYLIFLVVGVAMTVWEPTRAMLIGPIWLGFTLLIGAFVAFMVTRAKLLDRLRRRGVAAQAIARSVSETGLYVHEMPQVDLDLEVQAPGGGYEVTKRLVVPLGALEELKRGDAFPVRIEPGDRDALAFEWNTFRGPAASWLARGAGSPPTVDPVTRLAQLDELRAHSTMTTSEYERLRAEIEADGLIDPFG